MNKEEIKDERNIERQVVIYVRFPSSATDQEVFEMSEKMYEFVDMLGVKVKDHFWEVSDDFRRQPKLSKAIDSALETKYGDLITYDLLSLTPDRHKSLKVAQQMLNNGGFVNFIDDEAVLMECQMIMEHQEDKEVWN